MRLKTTTKKRSLFLAAISMMAGFFILIILLIILTSSTVKPNNDPEPQITDNQITNLTNNYNISEFYTEEIPLLSNNENNSVSILMYHHVGTEYDGYLQQYPNRIDSNVVKEIDFAEQMKYLSENDYNTSNMFTLITAYKNGYKLPAKTVVLTFDDGYRDFYTAAFPILKKYHIHATVNIITNIIGEPNILTWDMLKEIKNSGLVTIGSHTMSHKSLPSLTASKLKEELEGSKKILESNLGIKVTDFCYPSGAFNDKVVQAVKDAGYTDAITTIDGKWKFNNDLYKIPRQRISYGKSITYFKNSL